jgi:hypothetical protein
VIIRDKLALSQSVVDRISEAAVAEFIRTRGVTRCPTACVLPTQATPPARDRAALAAYSAAREEGRRARAARLHPFFPNVAPRTTSE